MILKRLVSTQGFVKLCFVRPSRARGNVDSWGANVETLESYHLPSNMGKLNIAHHKSYHPYRRDNIEKVRRDEEEARLKEEKEEGRMLLAVSPRFCWE